MAFPKKPMQAKTSRSKPVKAAKPKTAPKPPSKPAKPKTTPKRAAANKPEPKVKDFHGMQGVRTKKQREAIEGVIGIIRRLWKLPAKTEVKLYGAVAEATGIIKGKAVKQDSWGVCEISAFTPNGSGGGAGTSLMRCDAPAVAILAATEDLLAAYHAKPRVHKKTKEVVEDARAESESMLEVLVKTPDAGKLLEIVAYLLWRDEKSDKVSLKAALDGRMFGFYGPSLKSEAEAALLGSGEKEHLWDRFEQGIATPPNRIYELRLRGYRDFVRGELRTGQNSRVKFVATQPEGLAAWLAGSPELKAALEEPPIDIAKEYEDKGDVTQAEDLLRTFKYDVLIDYRPQSEGLKLAFAPGPDGDVFLNSDPAPTWVADSAPAPVVTPEPPATVKDEKAEEDDLEKYIPVAAEIYSDDRTERAIFDAQQWFAQATDEKILGLATEGYENDVISDEVALFFSGKDEKVTAVLEYVDSLKKLPNKKDVAGFGCRVDQQQAIDWVENLRPHLMDKLAAINDGETP